MKEDIPNDIEEMPTESFWKTLENLQKKPGHKYDFILKAGESLKSAILKLFETAWITEEFPTSWQESTVTQVYKGKGKQSDLVNLRNLHSRDDEIGKVFSQIVLSHAKENLFKHMSKYQIACKPGHRPSEHLYGLKCVYEHYKTQDK